MVLVCCPLSVDDPDESFVAEAGKLPGSFNTLDPLRLPLGILSGVGFIGAVAILHKVDVVPGVTTTATLWIVTVLGLCFGRRSTGAGVFCLAVSLGESAAFAMRTRASNWSTMAVSG